MTTQARNVWQQSEHGAQSIEDCRECYWICMRTIRHALEMGGRHAESIHINLLLDCAEICQTTANFMIRGSDQHSVICSACAALCLRCAEACERFDGDDLMKACAEACRRCADSCQVMVANMSETSKV